MLEGCAFVAADRDGVRGDLPGLPFAIERYVDAADDDPCRPSDSATSAKCSGGTRVEMLSEQGGYVSLSLSAVGP